MKKWEEWKWKRCTDNCIMTMTEEIFVRRILSKSILYAQTDEVKIEKFTLI